MEKLKKIIENSYITSQMIEDIKTVMKINKEDYFLLFHIYAVGMARGKQEERNRRNKAVKADD